MRNPKQMIADELLKKIKTLPNEEKEKMINKFIEKHKDSPDFEQNLAQLKRSIEY